jgi:hypothetical protein
MSYLKFTIITADSHSVPSLVSCAKMPQHEMMRVIIATKEKHLLVSSYIFLCQLTIAIVTFYCAIAISHYNPIIASSTPRGVPFRTPYSDANSTTPHICKTGVRKDFEDLDAVLIVRYSPSSSLFPFTLAYVALQIRRAY